MISHNRLVGALREVVDAAKELGDSCDHEDHGEGGIGFICVIVGGVADTMRANLCGMTVGEGWEEWKRIHPDGSCDGGCNAWIQAQRRKQAADA